MNDSVVYPMTKERKSVQLDCRNTGCTYYQDGGDCANPAPAITLNANSKYVCWSKKVIGDDDT